MADKVNQSADIIVVDHLDPESEAMLQALYSRSPKSVREHLKKVEEVGPQNFMGQYYVGYGHKSIGDCGSTNIFIENVSMLVAKAIQHNRLYNGQEASTRYLNMAEQEVLNPLGTEAGKSLQNRWMALYSKVLAELVPYLTEKYPMLPGDKEGDYKKAIKAKAFDIARAFLPAGCTTYVSWHSNLRQAWDHLLDLRFHPLAEVRQVAESILSTLRDKYSSSFNFKHYEKQDEYLRRAVGSTTYADLPLQEDFSFDARFSLRAIGSSALLMNLLETRPEKTELPSEFERYGSFTFNFGLDFGSFRDLQRHRSCYQPMPLLTTQWGFHPWYLESLPERLREEAKAVIKEQEFAIAQIGDKKVRQYYIAMGYLVSCEVTASLPSAVYIAELRSGQAVHPTLRKVAQEMGKAIQRTFPSIALHCDFSEDAWSTIRGKHDIVKKEEK